MTLIEFARRIEAERRATLGAALLRRVREEGIVRISAFDDPEIRPLLEELELAEKLVELARTKP